MTNQKNKTRSKGARQLKVKVRTARGRKLSSTRWLERQLNDPFVQRAKEEGLRSRAAFKLSEIDDQYKLLRSGMRVVDLGAAPGGWSQIAVNRVQSVGGEGQVVAIDLNAIEPIPGVDFLRMDFMELEAVTTLTQKLKQGRADIVLSDMAAPASGHKQTDHLRIISLVEVALEFALDVLEPGGHFLAKVLQGGTEQDLLRQLKQNFNKTRHVKPKASRADSSELYVLATGFKG